jgi:acetyl esterase/lipase
MRRRRCIALVAAALGWAAVLVPVDPATAAPVVTLDPSTGLVDRQLVEVRGSGLPGNEVLRVRQCWSGSTDDALCDRRDGFAVTSAGGRFELPVTLDATPRPDEGPAVDCRQPALACTLVVFGTGPPGEVVLASVALAFAAGAPLAPPPQLILTPPADLHDGLPITAVGTGFRLESIPIRQCRSPVQGPGSCTSAPVAFAPLRSDGSFVTELRAEATIGLADGEHRDCRVAGCVLFAGDPEDADEAGVAPLVFTPGSALAPPPTLDPPGLLVDGQAIVPAGGGYRPGAAVHLWECLAGTVTSEGCVAVGTASAQRGGRLAASALRVDAWLRTPAGEADCRAAPPACVLVAGDLADPDDLGRTPLRFRSDSPVRPPRALQVDPGTPLRDGQLVTVRGVGFREDDEVQLQQCPATSTSEWCSGPGALAFLTAGAGGTFVRRFAVARSISTEDGVVDCGTAGRCVLRATTRTGGPVVVDDGVEEFIDSVRIVTDADLVFRSGAPQRYVEPVFADVDVTRDVHYRTAVGADGRSVELRLDIFQPAGDTEQQRPAVVWMHGGFFRFGGRSLMEEEALDSARRGYVAVTIDYRLSPQTDGEAIRRAFLDARASVRWLQANAATYRVDPEAIAAGGSSAGAVTALNLAHAPALSAGHRSGVRAAISLSGTRTFGVPEAGEPPVLMFHGTEDSIVPFSGAAASCELINTTGASCRFVRYDGTDHGLGAWSPHVHALSARFLAQHLVG